MLVVLGAGRPARGDSHTGLQRAVGNTRVLDWLVRAADAAAAETHFVAGFEEEAVRQRYPEFQYWRNEDWQSTRAAYSLLKVDFGSVDACTAVYSDVLFRDELVVRMALEEADVVVAVDSHWRTRFVGRSGADMARCEKACIREGEVLRLGADLPPDVANAEFVGCVRFNRRALERLQLIQRGARERFRQWNLSELVEDLRLSGLSIRAVDVCGDWAELREERDLARFVLGTKAQTLQRLRGMLGCCRIEDQVCFTVADWRIERQRVLADVRSRFGDGALVVRSSALSEDGFSHSNAGAYTSLLNVDGSDDCKVAAAVDEVIASFEGHEHDEVLVQPMLRDVRASGVVFTRTLSNGAPYYVANYDDVTGSTESITSGNSREHTTLVVRRDVGAGGAAIPAMLRGLVPALKEIEGLLGYDSIDVEFAVTGENQLHILQVRPIAVHHAGWGAQDEALVALVDAAREDFCRLQAPAAFVVGRRTLFGVMPDWNPAEIIGPKPNQLAFTLYRHLIMDEVWAAQRAQYGYRDVRPHPLMVSFAGHPYVDVRASFNSFIPACLDDSLAARLVDFSIDWLQAHPHLHDKVEFDVVPTCYALDFERWERRLQQGGFSDAEVAVLREGLLHITAGAVHRTAGDMKQVHALEARFARMQTCALDPLSRAWQALEDCRLLGTLPFAHLARGAFVAMTLLRSAVSAGVLTAAELEDFLATIRTVSHTLTEDARATAAGTMRWECFVERYGHLRPGTYDIVSPSYRADPERFLRPIVEGARTGVGGVSHDAGRAWSAARDRLVRALAAHGITLEGGALESFLRTAIEGREYAKFAFTRNLSCALDALAEWGAGYDVGVDELAHVGIEDLLAFRQGSLAARDVRTFLRQRAAEGRALVELARAVELPPLITEDGDFIAFQYPASHPNFVGSGRACAPCVSVVATADDDLAGRIALIPQADPGYDWLFGRGIAGLVTMFGGANSHMAIRAAEFGLPAAIGIGQTWFETLANAQVLDLDAGSRTIRVVR